MVSKSCPFSKFLSLTDQMTERSERPPLELYSGLTPRRVEPTTSILLSKSSLLDA